MDEPSAPFDEFSHPGRSGPEKKRGLLGRGTRTALQGISFGGVWVALLTAILIVALHTFRILGGKPPEFVGTLKSAVPLMAIGISYISLIFTVPRTMAQRFLGILVGLAFVLWGLEQFMNHADWIAYVDDLVVFLFVLDLSIVIRENLKRSKEPPVSELE